ncbi:phage tail family protein [Desulfosporosinus sp. PR]|uniref:phage tail family protein n=1 Tax=Candidatus Desulfosporosinus nitrosoreducens TaxID=3401928 RepID=UPI0027F844F2|nr:phage tail family protein [Desulfosporosinus sp. PR]MDQ7095940.1 phage tail family protein [Desulfosporosinus sp. PR]
MQQIVYTNSSGESVTLMPSRPLILQSIEGTGSVKNNIHTSKSPDQDGNTVIGKDLDSRELVINGSIGANTDTDIMNYRRQLVKAFNPKEKGVLTYSYDGGEKAINCEVEDAPVFPKRDGFYQTFSITLLCPNPFWQDLELLKAEIAAWIGDFSFPLEITEIGIEMGHREPSLIVNTLNSGDVECGMRVEFKALATLTNPSILNVNTQEFIKINKTMVAGEVLTITTHFGAKRVESVLNGVTTNAFNYIDLDSTFLQLDVGDNLFRYDADINLDNLEVSIYYTPQYLGV